MEKKQYEDLLRNNKKELEKLNKKIDKISLYRLVIFISVLMAFSSAYIYILKIMYFVGMVLISTFIYVINIHNNIKGEKNYKQSKIEVLQRYLDRFTDNWHNFTDDGSEFIKDDSYVQKDLDIFGKASVYQYISTCNTQKGKIKLSNFLTEENFDKNIVINRQKAVLEIHEKDEFSIHFQTLSNLIKESKNMHKSTEEKNIENKDIQGKVIEDINDDMKLLSIINILSKILPVVAIVTIILTIIGKLNFAIPFGVCMLQLLLSFIFFNINSKKLNDIFVLQRNLDYLGKILESLEKENFNSFYLKNLKDKIKNSTKAIKNLKFIGECVNLRKNQMFYIVIAALFMWEFQCVSMFDAWKKSYGKNIWKWLETIGEIEAIISLSIILDVKKNCSFPIFDENKLPNINVKNMFHPLIKEEDAVLNDFSTSCGTSIITGSNMSGKTTFLRCIGVNLILAYAGAPVCAEHMNVTYMKLFTSMRVNDDVSQGISTFYAEILRIKSMIEHVKNKSSMICLIDEIFKGTNSADRIYGAKEVIKKLTNEMTISIVSTHDFELCDLENIKDQSILNYHFEEYYENDNIKFDYKIKSGKCITTNAKYLLKMAGLI